MDDSKNSKNSLSSEPSSLVEQNQFSPAVHARKKHVPSIGSLLAGGDPIVLFSDPANDPKLCHRLLPGRPAIPLGQLLIAPSSGSSITVDTFSSNQFDITYSRPDSSNPDQNGLRPDDAAMLARAFMLAKMTTSRLEMQATLSSLAEARSELEKCSPLVESDEADDAELTRVIEAVVKPVELRDRNADATKLRSMFLDTLPSHGRGKRAQQPLLIPRLAEIEDRLASGVERTRSWMQRHKGSVFILNAAIFSATIAWVWLPYWLDYRKGWPIGPAIVVLLVLGMIFMLLNALNLKRMKDQVEEFLHERAVDKLNSIVASLVQSNANVAASYVRLPVDASLADGLAPEPLLCEMDRSLNLKDRLNSIEAVVKARQAHVTSGVKHIEEHRDRVRRSITAAGSGLTVGFFTYEVGESVTEYLHVSHQQDPSAMLYWLFENEARIAQTKGASASPGGVLVAPVARAQASQATTTYGPTPKEQFVASFHKPELLAHSILLTITIIVSVFTAWIAMRKPAAEQTAGHAHH